MLRVPQVVTTTQATRPECAMWASVLLGGLCDFAKGELDAMQWVANTGLEDSPGSFTWLCELFKLDAAQVRISIRTEEFKRYITAPIRGKILAP